MSDGIERWRGELALANRILAHEGILDVFGHVSVRHPNDPGRYLLSRSRSPELVEPADIVEHTLDGEPVRANGVRLYAERVIHGCIYRARPDVQAVCHHHAPAILPFCAAGVDLVPVFHLGATMGATVPFWDSRDEFGDTDLLVATPEQGKSLAKALGHHWVVLMRRHGATVAGRSLHEVVFRSIYSSRNAEIQCQARAFGTVGALSRGEIQRAGDFNLRPLAVERAWEYWTNRLQRAGAAPRRAAPPAKRAKTRRATTKTGGKGRGGR